MSWDTGWYASGTVEALEKPNKVTLAWRGKDAPGATKVAVTLEPSGEKTHVQIVQSGFGEGEDWDTSRELAAEGWEAGLKGDDVIVEMDGTSLRSWEDLGPVLQRRQAGDVVSVVFYRGADKQEVEMELMGRPIPDLDLDPVAFAQSYREVTAEVIKDLKEALEGVTEAEAEISTEDDWSIKENLAHLVLGEEYNIKLLTELLQDGESQYAGGGENRRETLRAIVRTTPTTEMLVQRLERAQKETCSMLEESESVLGARKGVMWRLGSYWLHYPGGHEREHIEQMMKELEMARAAAGEEVPA